jgi:HSP20 family protein
MSDITVRKNGDTKPATITRPRQETWEPFRVIGDLMAWDPFREMTPLTTMPQAFMPSFEIKETKEAYVFKADVPGVKRDDIAVSLTGTRLTVSGKREEERKEQGDTFYAYERTYGDFQRAFTLPENVDGDAVNADLDGGVLTITVRKKPEAVAKKIEVQTPAKKS